MSDHKRLDKSNLNKTNPLVLYLHGFSERAPGGSGQSSQEVRDGECFTMAKLVLMNKIKKNYISLKHE